MSKDEATDTVQMRCALSAIAKEMQKFHDISLSSDYDMLRNDEVLGALLKYKTTIKLKKDQIRMLQQNLKTACIIAKTLSAAKANETASLHNQLNHARNQYWDLEQQEKEKTSTISTLQAENQNLRNRLQCFINFIQLGYKELQNCCNEPIEDIPSLKQLQKIVYFCCQYCADHMNLEEKYNQLEHKNRFMTSKLSILESQLDVTTNELRCLRNVTRNNINVQKELTMSKIPNCCVGVVQSEHQLCIDNNNGTKFNDQALKNNKKYLDLSRHLSTVKKLLNDQDTLINDLRTLSKEFN